MFIYSKIKTLYFYNMDWYTWSVVLFFYFYALAEKKFLQHWQTPFARKHKWFCSVDKVFMYRNSFRHATKILSPRSKNTLLIRPKLRFFALKTKTPSQMWGCSLYFKEDKIDYLIMLPTLITSANTPAAVTSAPAPGPLTTKGRSL